jgi:hypothetical protein
MGQRLRCATGEAAPLDADDRAIFYGQRFRGPEMTRHTDERATGWRRRRTGAARSEVAATPQFNLAPPADFPDTLRAEESLEWWTLHTLALDTQDTWFWAHLQPSVQQEATASLGVIVPDPAPGAPATLRAEVIAKASSYMYVPDHRTTVALNGVGLLDELWDGKVRRVFQAAVPGGLSRGATPWQ